MAMGASFNKKWKKWNSIFERAAYDLGYWTIIFLTVGAVGASVGGIFFPNHIGYLISSYIFFIIGLVLLYRKHPVGALVGFLSIIFLGIITLAVFFQKNFDFLTAGITGILVIITGWYAKNMHTQIQIMNNEKLGKVITEISISIFSPLEENLKHIKWEFETNFFIEQLLPTKFSNLERKLSFLQYYLEGDIEVFTITNISRTIKVSARRLLNINDEHLLFAIHQLKKLDVDYKKNIDDLKILFKQFDDDFLPYFQEFKSKCIDLSNSSHLGIPTDENYFKLILKFSMMKQDATPQNIGSAFEPYAHQCAFINEKRNELYSWIQNIVILRNDIQNIENEKIILICCIDEMIKEVDILLYNWKITYYLTETEMRHY